MADESQSAITPASSTERQPASKNKECPFCHQPFTSSSLGRHLDLFIREKNPKPADELHDLTAIRRLRGSITRRQPRKFTRRDRSTPSSVKDFSSQYQRSPVLHGLNGTENDGEPFRTYVNQTDWQATGVMNELLPAKRDHRFPDPQRATFSKLPVKEEIKRKEEYVDIVDRARALELALREVLESYKVARSSEAYPPSPFEFNFFGLSYPQIHLQCLASPPSLLVEAAPRPHELAWTVDPPAADHCDRLRSFLAEALTNWRRNRRGVYNEDPNITASNGTTQPEQEIQNVDAEEASYYRHLDTAFEEWKEKSDLQRNREWHHECAKAFAREREKHQDTKRKLEAAEQEIRQLRNGFDQVPLERYTLTKKSPSTASQPLSRQAVSHLPVEGSFDFNALIKKWQGRVQSAKSAQQPLPKANNRPSATFVSHGEPSDEFQDRDTTLADAPRMHADPADEDADLLDAPGEEDLDHIATQSQQLPLNAEMTRVKPNATVTPHNGSNGFTHTIMDLA